MAIMFTNGYEAQEQTGQLFDYTDRFAADGRESDRASAQHFIECSILRGVRLCFLGPLVSHRL